MENRRVLFKSLLAAGLAATASPPARGAMIKKQPLSGDFDGMEASFIEVTYQPGKDSPQHRHGGFVLGYVIEGQFKFAIKGQTEVLGPGEAFYEPPDAVHTVSGSANDQPAKILAIIVAKKDARLTTPA